MAGLQRRKKIKGQPHELAWMTPKEAKAMNVLKDKPGQDERWKAYE